MLDSPLRPHIDIRIAHDGVTAIVTVSGEVDMATAPDMTAAFNDVLDGHEVRHLIVDLLDVPFLDSSGLGALVAVRQSHPDLEVSLVVASGIVRRAIETTGLEAMFRIGETVADLSA
jgi:anti-sigma B factor antagonist